MEQKKIVFIVIVCIIIALSVVWYFNYQRATPRMNESAFFNELKTIVGNGIQEIREAKK